MSIEDLANLEVTSVSKRAEPVSKAAASIFVITADDIRRSGATSVPEVLRLAPNLNVTRRDSLLYAISARGFNTAEASNKLLVMIDGRSIYTPFYSGVFWDQNHVMLDDIARIEVVSGPGGTLWGPNAVNGVINIVTKNSQDTQGGLVNVQAGNIDRAMSARYGTKLSENATMRIFGTAFERAESRTISGANGMDEWDAFQGGFRADWSSGRDSFTAQGDLYEARVDDDLNDISNRNLLGRWSRSLDDKSALKVQAYYDDMERDAPGAAYDQTTFDIEAQHNFKLGAAHDFVWGGGYRNTKDAFFAAGPFFVLPTSRTTHLTHAFVQDAIALQDDLTLTVGLQLQYSSFSGFEYLPSARVAWQKSDRTMFWSAISRSVRAPSRLDKDLVSPGLFIGGPNFDAEEVVAYEVGYRGLPADDLSVSVTVYFNEYDSLRTTQFSPGGVLPLLFGNERQGETYGVEAWGEYTVTPSWRLTGGLNLLEKDLRVAPGVTTVNDNQSVGNDPSYQLFAGSHLDLEHGVEVDVTLRAVDDLDDPRISGYVEADARVGWHVTDDLEVSLSGSNLLDSAHPETGELATLKEVRRSVLLGARLRF